MKDKRTILDSIRFVLVEPQVPGNIGASARALKNMGFRHFVLVNPWFIDHPQARYMAHGSSDILDSVKIVDDVGKAVADSVLVVGTTHRKRHNTPLITVRTAALKILDCAAAGPVSVLFGREDKGLTNDEVRSCQLLITIPSSQAQPSLNLSQAVMIVAYELYTAAYPVKGISLDLAASAELEKMYEHLERSLESLGFRQWNDGDNYMKSLRRVFSRTMLECRDVATIHKLWSEIDKFVLKAASGEKEAQ